ncbi:MAG: hypothetical protein E6J90_00850 [Deltaproteobacteria bacterium]|nr:MAG: hypothetical protein E6J91_30555 [Deltaproteobacteria bacterium]TMQ28211.1 MAG: hypothetical protein E6J90_00850 [Deltaproteobacteria bacterium]
MADFTDLIERFWDALSRWAVPVMMTLAYAFLALTSETNTTGKAWMAAGLVLVMVVWFTFRALTTSAALSRALSVGDIAKLFELAEQPLARRGRPPRRARFLVARGLAHLLRGEHAAALAALDEAPPPPDLQSLATTLRIVLLIELHRPVDPTDLAVRAPRAPWLAWLADGLLAWRADRFDDAAPLLARVTDDVRAGSALRAIAHLYAARLADARGDLAAAGRHRASATELADPDAAWLRGEPAPPPA